MGKIIMTLQSKTWTSSHCHVIFSEMNFPDSKAEHKYPFKKLINILQYLQCQPNHTTHRTINESSLKSKRYVGCLQRPQLGHGASRPSVSPIFARERCEM